jgi:hypothetical protein
LRGWSPVENWTDDERLFSVILAKEGGVPAAPRRL